MAPSGFGPATDLPSLQDRVIVVTGGNSGLGYESILQLAKHAPAKIYMASRSAAKASSAIAQIRSAVPSANLIHLPCDLSDLLSVKAAAEAVLQTEERLDLLLNNAGVMAPPSRLTKQGYEVQFGVNHMGHALFTMLLLPLLRKTANSSSWSRDVRVVTVSSDAIWLGPKDIQYPLLKTPMETSRSLARYGQSKLANLLFAVELARKCPEIKSIAIHPGVTNTNIGSGLQESSWFWSKLFALRLSLALSVPDGAKNQLWALTSKDAVTGKFYNPIGQERKSKDGYEEDAEASGKLWEWTRRELIDGGYLSADEK